MLKRGSATGLPPFDVLFAPLDGIFHAGLAVSGGADSLALMLLAAEWAREHNVELTVYSVDHGLRPEAAAEAGFVVAEAQRRGLSARVLKWTGPKPEAGVQAAARKARYRLTGEAMREDGAEVLLTAHHKRDQAETLLMRLAHGSGLGGLGGMGVWANVEGVRVCRPLLDIAPEVLAKVVSEAGLTPVADPSNLDVAYERIRWRKFLPSISDLGLDTGRLGLFARRARRAEEALAEIAARTFASSAEIDDFGVVRIASEKLADEPAEIRIRILQMALRSAGGQQKPFDLQPVEALEGALRSAGMLPKRTLHGVMVEQQHGIIVFTREPGRVAPVKTIAAGKTAIWDGRFEIGNATRTPVRVGAEPGLTRKQLELLLGKPYAGPMSGPRGAPIVTSEDGVVLALWRAMPHPHISVGFVAPDRG